MILKNSKGQESIVFEVLIAVILMTFVFIIGGYAMTSLNQTKCSKEVDSTMSQLAVAIEKAGSVSIGSYYYTFSESSCFRDNNTTYILKEETSALCSSYCPGSTQCYLLKYNNSSDPVSTVRYKCVNISRYVTFNGGSCTNPPDAGYETLPGLTFSSGNYIFESYSLGNPEICIYIKK